MARHLVCLKAAPEISRALLDGLAIEKVPAVFILGADGTVRTRLEGAFKAKQLAKAMRDVLPR